jgi:predicted flap endonuclease-1-like 5' DNA nuclease
MGEPPEEEAAEKLDAEFTVEDTTTMIVPVKGDYFTFIKGVGKATSEKMVAAGYFSKEQVLNADDEDLKEEFGWNNTKVASIREQLTDES